MKWMRENHYDSDELLVNDSGLIVGGIDGNHTDSQAEAWLSGIGTPLRQHLGYYITVAAAKRKVESEAAKRRKVKRAD